MGYHASVYQVMIASPGDVPEERNAIQECLNRWNDIHAYSRKTVLLPVRWETHSVPESGHHPQELINQRLLRKCDLLVGVFSNRAGTPTAKAPSGTIEEIEEHRATGKPVMIYFSNAPIPRDHDPEQLKAVNEYQKSLRQNTLYWTYNDLTDFITTFDRQLAIFMNSDPSKLPPIEASPTHAKPSTSQEMNLSGDARELLMEACQGKNTNIHRMNVGMVSRITANRREFTKEATQQRDFARWQGALDELVEKGLVNNKGNKGAIYEITAKGYQVNDGLVAPPTQANQVS